MYIGKVQVDQSWDGDQFGVGQPQRLGIGVDGNEFDPPDIPLDHPIDNVRACTANPDHSDTGGLICIVVDNSMPSIQLRAELGGEATLIEGVCKMGASAGEVPGANRLQLVATGVVNVNVLPLPASLSTVIVPPCARTSCFTMARPRPYPPVWRARERSAR